DIYRHCKPLAAIGTGVTLLERSPAATALDPVESGMVSKLGVVTSREGDATEVATELLAALAKHRFFDRELPLGAAKPGDPAIANV
ncbi:MAG TPA: hypothetical protein VGC41_18595, partial [Kofleriaceae bacterium]